VGLARRERRADRGREPGDHPGLLADPGEHAINVPVPDRYSIRSTCSGIGTGEERHRKGMSDEDERAAEGEPSGRRRAGAGTDRGTGPPQSLRAKRRERIAFVNRG
jgi:hypothetical protein